MLAESLTGSGLLVQQWDRRAQPGRVARPWVPEGPFDLVAVRLPRAKEELAMVLHAAASVSTPTARLWLFGANDEGIKSIGARLAPLFENVRTLATGSHCRVLEATPAPHPAALRPTLAEWRTTFDPGLADLGPAWIGYPGVFAHGSLDVGTALLVGALPTDMSGLTVLDYGAGTGVLAGVCRARGADVSLLDVDTVALEAASENVPGAKTFAASSLEVAPPESFSAIVSNPPIHRGKAEAHDILEALVEQAPSRLVPKGSLFLVVQKRLGIEPNLDRNFQRVERIAEDKVFKVLQAQ